MEKSVKMKFHPRAFSAFGADLVTNDFVAVNELVKNGYDAFAGTVLVKFAFDEGKNPYIEIVDDGYGMSRKTIEDVWTVIATPYKKHNPTIERNNKVRIVSGNKGLGRFSAARLGNRLSIISKCESDDCFKANITWSDFLESDSLDECTVSMDNYPMDLFNDTLHSSMNTDSKTGTIIRIEELSAEWNQDKIDELTTGLARLLSPFEKKEDFSILVKNGEIIKPVNSYEFINNPPYCISGTVDDAGTIEWKFKHFISKTTHIEKDGVINWETVVPDEGFLLEHEDITYKCGSFTFEIRAWDLDSESIGEVSQLFNIKKSEIRKTISLYKGISVYRDGVLVLPKSDSTRDWLGIDIRRVSALGKRLSTSQMIGNLSISLVQNPGLKDTTDREKMVDTVEYQQFCLVVRTIVSQLENLRNIERKDNAPVKRRGLVDLISPLDTTNLVSKVEIMVNEDRNSGEILEAVREYSADAEKTLSELNDRLIYYAQTASLGSIAIVIIHEIRSGMTVIKRFLSWLKRNKISFSSKGEEYLQDAEMAHRRLLDVATSFAPFYRQGFSKEKYTTQLTEGINSSVRMIQAKKEARDIEFVIEPHINYLIGMHEGELQTILINLLDNACYWLNTTKNKKKIAIVVDQQDASKVVIRISDNGPGISADEAEKIFQPGITSKPGTGIGMGLAIVTELLNRYDCKISTIIPGDLDGATFIIELPVAKENK